MTPSRCNRSHGFTLTELIVSVSVMAVLMGGIASAMILASRAIPDGRSALDDVVEAYHAAEQIAGELYCAQSFTVRTPTAVEFTVADRDDDASAETVRYEWSGTPGDPLTRRYNGALAVDAVSDVYEFDLTYGVQTLSKRTTEVTTTWTEDAPIASFNGWSGVTGTNLDHLVNAVGWDSEYFEITPPAGATELKITRAQVMLKRSATIPGALFVGIHRSLADGSYEPAVNPIGTLATIAGTNLTTMTLWTSVTFGDVTITDPARTDYCLVIKGTGATPAYLRYMYNKSAPADATFLLWTIDSGASWEPADRDLNKQDLVFNVYGSFGTTGEQETTVDRYFLTSTRLALRIGSESSSRVETGAEILNAIEVGGP